MIPRHEGETVLCMGCGEIKPLTLEFFRKDVGEHLRLPCRLCINKQERARRRKRRERERERLAARMDPVPQPEESFSEAPIEAEEDDADPLFRRRGESRWRLMVRQWLIDAYGFPWAQAQGDESVTVAR